VFLVLHNLDGPGLRTPEAQQALCVLVVASQSVFKIVATSDNVNSAVGLWDLPTRQNFNWAYSDATTFEAYQQEIAHFAEGGRGKKKSRGSVASGGKSNAGGVGQVLKSLAPRHAELMKVRSPPTPDPPAQQPAHSRPQLLAKYQMENSDSDAAKIATAAAATATVGMEMKEFKRQAQLKLLVTNDTQMNLLLVELQEHALVSRKRSPEGVEFITIPHPPELVLMIRDWGTAKT
jgi:hypothetical protein